MTRRWVVAIVVVLLVVYSLTAGAAGEKLRCAHCGMILEESSPFSARIDAQDKTLWFCDIGDMVLYINEKKADPSLAQVKDYPTGAWIAASKAFYVSSPKKFRTPMGWGLAAFRNRADASGSGEVDDLASILKRIQ